MEVCTFSEWRRKLILELAGDDPARALRVIYALEKYKDRDKIYNWLVSKGITGKNLIDFYFKCGGTPHRLVEEVSRRQTFKL